MQRLLHSAERAHHRLWRALAHVAEEAGANARGWKANVASGLRVVIIAGMSFSVNEVPVRASALVFTTLLAFIPFTIILSSVVGALGFLDLLHDLIPYLLSSLNLQLPVDPLLSAVTHAESLGFHSLGVFGSLGLLAGFYLSMSSVEEAMNRVWNVRKGRGWGGRLVRYTPFLLALVAVLTAAIYLLFHARGILAEFGFDRFFDRMQAVRIPGASFLFGAAGVLLLLWLLMFLMIRLLPNTRVRTRSALLGATTGIIPLYLLSRGLFLFPALLLERNQLFYGSLAVVPVALLLVYVFWISALFGGAVAFVHERQHRIRHFLFFRGTPAGMVEDWKSAMRQARRLYLLPGEDAHGEPPA